MDQTQLLLILVVAAAIGLLSIIVMLRRQRRDRVDPAAESEFAVSTEGSKRCPTCGMGNAWTEATCISCGGRLPG